MYHDRSHELYLLGRQAEHASLEDFKAYMLLIAVKNRKELAVEQIRQEICKTDSIVESSQKGSLTRLALSMTSLWLEGRLFRADRSDYVGAIITRILTDLEVHC